MSRKFLWKEVLPAPLQFQTRVFISDGLKGFAWWTRPDLRSHEVGVMNSWVSGFSRSWKVRGVGYLWQWQQIVILKQGTRWRIWMRKMFSSVPRNGKLMKELSSERNAVKLPWATATFKTHISASFSICFYLFFSLLWYWHFRGILGTPTKL